MSLANRNMKEVYRDPLTALLGLAMPLALLILFSSVNKKIRLDIFSPQMLTPGIIVFCFAFLIMFSAILLSKDRQTAFLTRLFTTPLRPADFILAYTLPFIPLALIQTAVCLLVGVFLGAAFSNVLFSLIIFLLITMICLSIGMIMGSLLTMNQVSGVGSVFVTAIGLFSGAWMDLKMVGGVFERIGYALPFAHAVDAAKGLLAGSAFTGISGNFYPLLCYAVVLFLLAIVAFRWKMKQG
jgi:ABC-2 type transport system permease protein